jgi:hypothetical protein
MLIWLNVRNIFITCYLLSSKLFILKVNLYYHKIFILIVNFGLPQRDVNIVVF